MRYYILYIIYYISVIIYYMSTALTPTVYCILYTAYCILHTVYIQAIPELLINVRAKKQPISDANVVIFWPCMRALRRIRWGGSM
jgi:hypothetical protein